jgi:hypothetical protein
MNTPQTSGRELRCPSGVLWGRVLLDGSIELKNRNELRWVEGALALRVWCPLCRAPHKYQI